AFALYDALPDPVPTHWNIRGEADGFTPKPWGAFVIPIVSTFTFFLLAAIPFLARRSFEAEGTRLAYEVSTFSILGFLLVITVVTLLAGAGFPIAIDRVIPAGIGLLLMIVGGVIARTDPNRFIGIRTRATLSNEEIWRKTHRLGGKVFAIAGAIVFAAAILGASILVLVATVLIAPVVPIVYAAHLSRKATFRNGDSSPNAS
ncbi:MAG TPA: SdpI family protein, partial [Planctomycetota bacterium]|nr:SdpI family protein [Planctomycetota bacterium]